MAVRVEEDGETGRRGDGESAGPAPRLPFAPSPRLSLGIRTKTSLLVLCLTATTVLAAEDPLRLPIGDLSFAWASWGIAPISSTNSVPLSARRNRP